MADNNRLTDAMRTHITLACPSCGQALALYGLMVQDDEEMACSHCNTLFRLKIDGGRVEAIQLTPPTGAPLGPAELPDRQ